MQEKLLAYYLKSCDQFLLNYRQALSGFDVEAVHDMRVAVKRIRAVNLLLDQLIPEKTNAAGEERIIRGLFRLSGKIRDHQVQLQLLSEYTAESGTPFVAYQQYLKKGEHKAIRKFVGYLAETDAEAAIEDMQKHDLDRISLSGNHAITGHIVRIANELLAGARSVSHDRYHDEHLHEIRRKIKYCLFLLNVFDKDDPNLSKVGSSLKKLEKAGLMLGNWHDHVVAVEMLKKFFGQSDEKDTAGNDLYWWFMIDISEKKQLLHRKIMNYLAEKFSF